MKYTFINRLMMMAVALMAVVTVQAQEVRINLGELELNKEYALEDFKNYIGTFTAPSTGVVTCESTTNDVLYPYFAELENMNASGNACDITINSMYGQKSYDFKVEEGKTYYMYANFIMNSGTVFKMTMAESQTINLVATSPSDGVFRVSNGGQISFDFDKAVSATAASISCNGKSLRISPMTNVGCIFFEVKSIIWKWYNEGTAHGGDTFNIKVTGVCMASDKSVLYNGDGILEASFTLAEMPITLVDTENTSGDFLSYYTDNDPNGVVRLTFSGPVREGAQATIKYGSVDQDSEGEYYVESLPVTVDGNTLSINLQGKRRRPVDMVNSGTNYGSIYLGITGVFDTNGNYAYSEGDGSLGSYWYTYTLKEVTSNVVAEFTPANGSDIDKTKNIEIWVTDESKLSYSGILFTYEKDGVEGSVLVTDIKKEADPDDATAMILTLDVPAELQGAKNIVATFKDLQCADGSDYSAVLRAKYNAFIISRSTPVANGTYEYLNAEQSLRIYINKDADVQRINLVLRDMNPAEGDDEILYEGEATKESKGFSYSIPRNIRLEVTHDYRLEATAYNASGEEMGSDYVIYHGASTIFRFSDVLLESILPAENSTLTTASENVISVTFDGLVLVNEETYMIASDGSKVTFNTIEPVNPNEEGYANTWNLVLAGSSVSGESMTLHLVAFDLNDNRVEGNTDKKEYSYTSVVYKTDSSTGIYLPQTDKKKSKTYNLQGQPTISTKGVVISDGKKKYMK